MNKLLKSILIIQFLSWTAIIGKLYPQPLNLFIALLGNMLVWFALWKGTDFVVSNPEDSTVNKRINVLRWIVSFFFSVFAVELGIIIAFIVRYFIDSGYVQGSVFASTIVEGLGNRFQAATIGFGVLLAFPAIYLIIKALKFAKPLIPAIIFTVIWLLLILFIGKSNPNNIGQSNSRNKVILSGEYYLSISQDFSSRPGIYGGHSVWLEKACQDKSKGCYPYFSVTLVPEFLGVQTEKELVIDGVPFSISCQEGKLSTLCGCDLTPRNQKIPIMSISIGCGLENPATYEEMANDYVKDITFSPDLKEVLVGKALPKDLIKNDGSYFFSDGEALFRVSSGYTAELVAEKAGYYRVFSDKGIALYETENKEKNKGTCYYQWVFDLKTGEKTLLNSFVNTPELRKKYSAEEIGLRFDYYKELKEDGQLTYKIDDCWESYKNDEWTYNFTEKNLSPKKTELNTIPTVNTDDYEDFYYCYQEKPFTLTKESLVGGWHANTAVGSGYSSRYGFYPDGTYYYFPSEMDCGKTLLRETGNWQLTANSLILEKKEEEVLTGGWYERSGGSCASRKTLKGATPKVNTLTTPTINEYSVDVGLQIRKEDLPQGAYCTERVSILIDKGHYWKYYDDPDSLIYQGAFPPLD